MANSAFGAVALTGGTAGSLDDIDHNSISDGDMAFVVDHTNEKFYVFTYDSTSSLSEAVGASDDQFVVKPDSNSGNGRWISVACATAKWDEMRDFLVSTSLSDALTGLGLAYTHEWIPAGAFVSQTTNGVTSGTAEASTDQHMSEYIIFAAGADDHAQYTFVPPDTWDQGDIKVKFYWQPATGASAGDKVRWTAEALSLSNDDAVDQSFTDAEGVTDTVLAVGDEHRSDATGAITVGGSPAAGDRVTIRVYRDTGHGDDDMAEDAYLMGIVIQMAHSNKVTAW